jgi:hypothetical protein
MPFAPNLGSLLPDLLAYVIERFLNGLAPLIFAPKPAMGYRETKHNES